MPQPARAAVRAAVRACLSDLVPGQRVIVAVSGGPDSLALAGAAARVAAQLGLVCEAVVVDHGLQDDSAGVARRAAEQSEILGCSPARVLSVSVAPRGEGPEAAARAARYQALLGQAQADPPAAAVLLGHTRDDQAETVLLGLARGSGTRSLAGMAPRSGLLRRPLLGIPREKVAEAALAAARDDPRLLPWTDPHNSDSAYARVRVRHDALPALIAALGPSVVESLVRTASLAREDADALDLWAQCVLDGARGDADADSAGRLPAAVAGQWAAGAKGAMLPRAVLTRVVRRFLIGGGCPPGSLTMAHVTAVTRLLADTPDAVVALPGGRHARREGPWLVVRA